MSGLYAIRSDLINVALVIAFAGLVTHISVALFRNDIKALAPTLIRLMCVSLTIAFIPQWGDQLTLIVQDVTDESGLSTHDTFAKFQATIAKRLGSDSAGVPAPVATTDGDTSGGYEVQDGHLAPNKQLHMLTHPIDTVKDALMWAFTLGLSWVACGLVWIMGIVAQILKLVEIAISPVFISCLMLPAVSHLARRWFLLFVGLSLWPLAFSISGIVTDGLLDLAANPLGNDTVAALVPFGPLSGLAYLVGAGVWTIGSLLAGPVVIHAMLATTGQSAVNALFGSVGRSASTVSNFGYLAVSGASSTGNGAFSGSMNGSAPPMSSQRIGSLRFSRRPVHPEDETEAYQPPRNVSPPVQSTMRMNPNNGSGRVKRLGADQISDV